MKEEIINMAIAIKALLYAIPAFLIWNAVSAIFKAYKLENATGIWQGNSFVYHTPLHVFTKQAISEENNHPFPFKINNFNGTGPEPNSFVYWKIDVEKAEDRVNATIDFKHGKNASQLLNWETGIKHGLTGGIKLPKDRYLSLVTCLKENTVPVIIRVYITSFKIQDKKILAE